ncbi:putative inositol hexakisphosphate and diphosphoinositol-pentakisphosphate kinase 1-like [Capsicum annuum]|nr:putative inositol hexakisphosphate and diphosphoinositol-pentakisphosphate kinase 1-like [Capsicum annuum]
MDWPKEVTGDLVLKCQLGKHFDELRSIMKNENIYKLFKRSYFAYFLKMSEDRTLCFPISMKNPLSRKHPTKGPTNAREKKDGLLGIVGRSYKEDDLMVDLEDKNIPKEYKEKLYLVWFVHFVLLSRDVRKVIQDDLLVLADDFEKFNDYPWGYDSYYLTIVYPWIVPTEQDLGMTSFITLGLVDTKVDPTMELINKKLVGATAIRRAFRQGHPIVEALHDQSFTATDQGASSGGVAGGVVNPGASQEKINTFENTPCTVPSHSSSPSCSNCKCKVCKDIEDKLLEKLEAIVEAAEELKSKRGVITSKKVRDPYTSIVQLAYPDAYDTSDRIMNLNFYNNFKDRHDDLHRLYLDSQIISSTVAVDFTQMNPPSFMGSKFEEDPQEFLDMVQKVTDAMGVMSSQSAKLAAYQLQDVAHT